MFIIWGKKYVYRKIGFVADFCPICRTVHAFVVKRVGLAGHLYYISAGEGELAGFERTCESCATTFVTDTDKYREIVKKSPSLADLRTQTFPDLDVVMHDRLALEARIAKAPMLLSRDERNALILGPFMLLAQKVEKRYASTDLDKEVGLALVAALVLMTAGPAASLALFPDGGPAVMLGFMVLALALVAWQMMVAKRRFMTRKVVPLLAKALRPLKPSDNELQAALAQMRQAGHKIGIKLKLPELQAQLH
ncbi:hypothetical protein LXA47_23700 [Massilia sp. P8910]|uniref:hypothetical protein n=1 Tax=Massilia antarctica TaxID=2765360 RepID=UPI001E4F0327|nr:hypothetical protein [Massilia antarctica]MCE3606581.1 hypothetical protein [Massilia antarctica]